MLKAEITTLQSQYNASRLPVQIAPLARASSAAYSQQSNPSSSTLRQHTNGTQETRYIELSDDESQDEGQEEITNGQVDDDDSSLEMVHEESCEELVNDATMIEHEEEDEEDEMTWKTIKYK